MYTVHSIAGYTLYQNTCYSTYARTLFTNFAGTPGQAAPTTAATEALCISICPATAITAYGASTSKYRQIDTSIRNGLT